MKRWVAIGMLQMLLGMQAKSNPVAFAPPITYSVGTAPCGVVVGDFNGDSKLDLAIANSGSNDISVLLGLGDGTFRTAVNYSVGLSPKSIALADIDGDGHLDLVVGAESVFIVLLGAGDGTFQAPTQYSAGISAEYVTLADFNGDQKPDLLASNKNGEIAVRIGNGDGTFQPPVITQTLGTTPYVAVADFDGDGLADFATGNGGWGLSETAHGTVLVFLSNGDGTFRPLSALTMPWIRFLTAHDIDGDGKVDLAAIATGGLFDLHMTTLRGNGDGTFAPSNDRLGMFASFVTVADVNRDGHSDLIGLELFDPPNLPIEVQIMLGLGDGAFTAIGFNPCEQSSGCVQLSEVPSWLATGDFNEDGTVDIVVANRNANSISIFLNKQTNTGFILSVQKAGTAQGTIASIPAGIECGGTCLATFAASTSVTLSASTNPGSTFVGWSGACSGTIPSCVITMNASVSATAEFTIAPDFSVVPASNTINLKRGTQASEVLSTTGLGGFTGTISLTCSVSGPTPMPTCSISPSSVTPGNSATLSLNAAALAAALAPSRLERTGMFSGAWLPLGLVGWVLTAGFDKKRRRTWLFCLLVMVATTLPAACGSGSSSTNGSGPPPQNYTVTVTATCGVLQHSTNINVTVD